MKPSDPKNQLGGGGGRPGMFPHFLGVLSKPPVGEVPPEAGPHPFSTRVPPLKSLQSAPLRPPVNSGVGGQVFGGSDIANRYFHR